jgi:Transglycosylase SLT domain
MAMACGIGATAAGEPAATAKAPPLPPLPSGAASGPFDVVTVSFANPRLAPVRVVRGPHQPLPAVGRPIHKQVVNFGSTGGQRVTVIRGAALMPVNLVHRLVPGPIHIETVSFADHRLPAVTVLRGPSARDWFSLDLYGPPVGGDLDRVAFAVDGVESRHGADFRMWRPEPEGPQGPMQVSAAAAFDVGGGDRFDMLQNRLLGRAYLAQMYGRYGNWPDALAAYNWGPGNMDQWIAGGRAADRLPIGVAWYVDRVLRDARTAKR